MKHERYERRYDRLQELVVDAARQAGVLAALTDSGMAPEKLQRTLELASGQFEHSALEVRKLCERHSPGRVATATVAGRCSPG